MTDNAFMSNAELRQASHALIDWFQSQDIKPQNAVMLMGFMIVNSIALMGHDRDDSYRGLDALYTSMKAHMDKVAR